MPQQGALDGIERVETPELVDLTVDLAGVGSRALACLVDTLICVTVMALVSIAVAFTSLLVGKWALAAIFAGGFLLQWFYFAVYEATQNGQTPGKKLLGLRVQKIGGYPIGWSEALIRNFLRAIDATLGYSVGIVVMLLTSRSQRLGDLAAGTVVVRERAGGRVELERIGYDGGASLGAGQAPALELSGQEFEMLHDFLARRDGLEPQARMRIAGSMAALMRRRLVERSAMAEAWRTLGDEAFLVQLDASFRGGSEAASIADGPFDRTSRMLDS